MDLLGLTSWKTIDGVLDTTIYLNQGLITQDISIIKDTVYHEIAHVLTGPNVGHGPKIVKHKRVIFYKNVIFR